MIRELRGMDVQMIACHEWHSAAVCDNGDLFTWGKNSFGCLGYECEKQLVPRRVKYLTLEKLQVSVVACGQSHTTIATVEGKTLSFGANNRGQLGVGDSRARTTPTIVEVLEGVQVVAVACGAEFTSAVTDTGQLWMWGANDQGQLGTGQKVDQLFPSRVDGIKELEVCDVSCGDQHTAILTTNGIVYCCGLNREGQLGQGTSSQYPDFSRPKPVSIPGKITQVACGSHSTIALAENGRIFTWGRGASGVLGHGDNKNRVSPTEVEGMSDKHVRMISCKGSHSAVTVVRSWVPDDEAKLCMACKLKFTTVRRRHHCRKCGGLFCDACSDKRFPLLSQGYSEPVRVCDRCYTLLTNEQ
jgi:alpha-tubulin suppressor-like RCC1 family protein